MMHVGPSVAVKGEILIDIARVKMDETNKSRSILRNRLGHLKPNEMNQVTSKTLLAASFQRKY